MMEKVMTITIADIAQVAGTSTATVSRALSDPDKVNAGTRTRIQQIAEELGYTPNRATRSHGAGTRTGLIGLIVPDMANPFFPPIIKAIQARAIGKQYCVLLADTDEHAVDEIDRARTMSQHVDGLILVSPRAEDGQLYELCGLRPTVLINRTSPNASSILLEDAAGINSAIEHLAALGHNRVCYLSGPNRSWSNNQRRKAIEQACSQHDLDLVEYGPFEPQIRAGIAAADLVAGSGIHAVVAYDDMIALGVMTRLSELGLKVGRDVSVIGIDDSPLSALAYPGLTSIHVPGAQAGSTAVDTLLDLIGAAPGTSNVDAQVIRLENQLVVRASTGHAPSGTL
jgi:DNA-binding LacI/PurR family transcriptional regulator